MWFRSGDLRSHSRTLIFCPWTTSGRPSQWARSPVLLEHHCSVNGHHFWQLGIKNFDVFLCIDDFIWFYVKYGTRLLAEKHPQIIIFCGCFIVDTVNRLFYRMLAGLRTWLRWVPNWQNVLSSLNMTRDHWAVVQFMYFWQKWSLFVTCFELRSGFRAACRLRRLNLLQRRRLTVLRLAILHMVTSFFTSEALRNGCFLIALSSDMSSLRVVHLRRPECCRLNTPPVSSNNFNVLPTHVLLQPTPRAIAE